MSNNTNSEQIRIIDAAMKIELLNASYNIRRRNDERNNTPGVDRTGTFSAGLNDLYIPLLKQLFGETKYAAVYRKNTLNVVLSRIGLSDAIVPHEWNGARLNPDLTSDNRVTALNTSEVRRLMKSSLGDAVIKSVEVDVIKQRAKRATEIVDAQEQADVIRVNAAELSHLRSNQIILLGAQRQRAAAVIDSNESSQHDIIGARALLQGIAHQTWHGASKNVTDERVYGPLVEMSQATLSHILGEESCNVDLTLAHVNMVLKHGIESSIYTDDEMEAARMLFSQQHITSIGRALNPNNPKNGAKLVKRMLVCFINEPRSWSRTKQNVLNKVAAYKHYGATEELIWKFISAEFQDECCLMEMRELCVRARNNLLNTTSIFEHCSKQEALFRADCLTIARGMSGYQFVVPRHDGMTMMFKSKFEALVVETRCSDIAERYTSLGQTSEKDTLAAAVCRSSFPPRPAPPLDICKPPVSSSNSNSSVTLQRSKKAISRLEQLTNELNDEIRRTHEHKHKEINCTPNGKFSIEC